MKKTEINLTIYFYFEKESFEFAILGFTMWKKKTEKEINVKIVWL